MRKLLLLVPLLCACPSIPVRDMDDAEFAFYLDGVGPRWERRARIWLSEHPDDAVSLSGIATLLEDAAGTGLTGTALTDAVEVAAGVAGLDAAVTLIVVEIVDAYEVQMRLGEEVPEIAARWFQIVEEAAGGVRRAATP